MKSTKVITICVTVFLTVAVIAEAVFIVFLLNREAMLPRFDPITPDTYIVNIYAEITDIVKIKASDGVDVYINDSYGSSIWVGANDVFFSDGTPAQTSDLKVGQHIHAVVDSEVNYEPVQTFIKCYRIIIFDKEGAQT